MFQSKDTGTHSHTNYHIVSSSVWLEDSDKFQFDKTKSMGLHFTIQNVCANTQGGNGPMFIPSLLPLLGNSQLTKKKFVCKLEISSSHTGKDTNHGLKDD